MKFTAEVKGTFKRAYKTVKKSVTSFLKKLGFNKTEVNKIATRIFDDIDETLATYVNSGINAEIDAEALEPIFDGKNQPVENNKIYNQKHANEYKTIFNEVNNFFTKEQKELKMSNAKLGKEQVEEEETYSR